MRCFKATFTDYGLQPSAATKSECYIYDTSPNVITKYWATLVFIQFPVKSVLSTVTNDVRRGVPINVCAKENHRAAASAGLHALARMNTEKVSRKVETNRALKRSRFLLSGDFLVVVFQPQMRDQVLTAKIAQCVFELHQLNENVVLRIKARGGLRRLEIKG